MAKNLIDRNGTWWIYFRRDKRRYRESTRIPVGTRENRHLAEDALAKRMREVADGAINGVKVKAVTFADFADDFLRTDSPQKKSKRRDRGILDMFKAIWKGENLDGITTKRIEDFKADRLQYRAPGTVAKELQVLQRLFKKGCEWGRIDKNPAQPVSKPRVNNGRVRYLEQDELDRLMRKLPGWVRPAAIFARFTGARRGEVFGLTWNDVDTGRGLIRFRDTKSGTDAHVEMNGTVRALLASLPKPINRAQRVFNTVDNNYSGWGKLSRAWDAACKAAKIEDFRWHDLRHQAATDLLTLGADLNDVRDFLRHKSMTMTLRYAHLVRARRKATAGLLDRLATKTATGATEEAQA